MDDLKYITFVKLLRKSILSDHGLDKYPDPPNKIL